MKAAQYVLIWNLFNLEILLQCGVDPDLVKTAVRLSVGRETTCKEIEEAVADIKQSIMALKLK
jgi:cysteine sulfinate desulfinase/cysteine desulfurase-like protein